MHLEAWTISLKDATPDEVGRGGSDEPQNLSGHLVLPVLTMQFSQSNTHPPYSLRVLTHSRQPAPTLPTLTHTHTHPSTSLRHQNTKSHQAIFLFPVPGGKDLNCGANECSARPQVCQPQESASDLLALERSVSQEQGVLRDVSI